MEGLRGVGEGRGRKTGGRGGEEEGGWMGGGGREGEDCHMSLLQNPLPDLASVPQANCEALSCTFCC